MASEVISSPAGCTTCSNGHLAFMTMDEDNAVFLECQECLTGYRSIEGGGETFRCEDLTGYRPSTRNEVERAVDGI